jgi:hypothetical protein
MTHSLEQDQLPRLGETRRGQAIEVDVPRQLSFLDFDGTKRHPRGIERRGIANTKAPLRATPRKGSRMLERETGFASQLRWLAQPSRAWPRTGDPQLGKRRRTRGRSITCALTTGISRHRAAYSGTGDGRRHPRGTRSGHMGVPPAPLWGFDSLAWFSRKQKSAQVWSILIEPMPVPFQK